MAEQIAEIFFKVNRQNRAALTAQGNKPFFTGMGFPVKRKEYIKIGLQEGGNPVVYADQISTVQRLFDLQLIGRQGAMEQLPVPGYNAFPQRIGIGNIKACLGLGQPSVPVVQNPAVQQIVPHTGGVAVVSIATEDNIG